MRSANKNRVAKTWTCRLCGSVETGRAGRIRHPYGWPAMRFCEDCVNRCLADDVDEHECMVCAIYEEPPDL